MSNNIHTLSAKQLAGKISKGDISSMEALEAYIARYKKLNTELNAIVATDFEYARNRAAEADKALKKGEKWGPLHGVPMTIKDTYETTHLPTTAGAREYSQHFAKKHAVATQKIVDAGAIIFGKTNVPRFGTDLQSYNRVYGTTNNPWNLHCTPGGSSGGAAASLAAQMTPVEFGSDIGGSIRTPAHFCGVFGHKPTYGIISLLGHIPPPRGALSEPDMAVAGPLAKTAEDLQLMMDIAVGPSPSMEDGWQVKLPASTIKSLKGARVLAWLDDPLCVIDSEMRKMYDQCIRELKNAGTEVTLGLPLNRTLEDYYKPYLFLVGSLMGATDNKLQLAGMSLGAQLLEYSRHLHNELPYVEHLFRGATKTHYHWLKNNETRLALSEEFSSVFDNYDIILSPITPTTAIAHQQKSQLPLRKLVVNGEVRNYMDQMTWISPATLMGNPASSAPIGMHSNGLPVNIQIIGKRFADKSTIKFAGLLSKLMGGIQFPPGYE